ncbi:MAG: hypothetical protein ABL890_00765 [Candidatus Peribacteraceae bacterium]
MTIRTLVLVTLFAPSVALFAPQVSAASLANVVIEQISPDAYGTWSLLAADGSRRNSQTEITDPKKYSAGISDFGPMTLSVTPPAGMTARITVYRGGEQLAVTDSRQHSFHMYPNDSYRFIIKYWVATTGTLGVISEPQGVTFRIESEAGRTYRAVTPKSFTNLPTGKYSIYANATAECVMPAPQSVELTNEARKVVTLSMSCDNASAKVDEPVRIRPTKRKLVESVASREARRKATHLIRSSR